MPFDKKMDDAMRETMREKFIRDSEEKATK